MLKIRNFNKSQVQYIMKRILFPTDFSEAAANAFLYVLNYANAFNAQVIILHVYDLPILDMPPLPETSQEIFEAVEFNSFEKFKAELEGLHKIAEDNNLQHITIKNVLNYGDLVYNINEVCKEEAIDVVMMGTKGATGIKEVFLGSTTSSVMQNVHVPVIGIPEGARFSKVKSILFTTQYRDKDNDALLKTLEIGKALHARVYCVYITNADDPEDIEERIQEWEIYYRDEDIAFFRIPGNDVEQALLDFSENQKIDLIVMRSHKRNFFESLFHSSLTRKMVYHTTIPLLIYKD